MRKIICLILIVALSVCLFCGCGEPEIEEKVYTSYDSTYWGMSKEDVLKMFSYVEFLDEKDGEISFTDARVYNMSDYSALLIATYTLLEGGYQFPEVKYLFDENGGLNEIEVAFDYKGSKDFEWFNTAVEVFNSGYNKDGDDIERQDELTESRGTFFETDDGGTEISIISVEFKKSLVGEYGSLTISYKPNKF